MAAVLLSFNFQEIGYIGYISVIFNISEFCVFNIEYSIFNISVLSISGFLITVCQNSDIY